MIRDWYKNAEQCFHEKKLVPMFHMTSLDQTLQKIYVIKYLQKYYEDEEVKSIFLDICEDAKFEFELLSLQAKVKQWPKYKDVDFYITQKEIDFINSIDTPREVRLYLLGFLGYVKFIKQQKGKAIQNTHSKSYMYYLTTHDEYNFSHGRYRKRYIEQQMMKINHGIVFTPCFNKINGRLTAQLFVDASWINWEANKGYHIEDLENDIFKLTDLIQDQQKICPNCGERFVVSKKAKTELCPSCYQVKRESEKHEHKEIVDMICPNCGKIFIPNGNTKTNLCPECQKIHIRKYDAERKKKAYWQNK